MTEIPALAPEPVSRDRLIQHLHALEGERHLTTSPDRLAQAQSYVAQQFTRIGCHVELDEFAYEGRKVANVIVTPRAADDRPHLIVGAHFDTVSGTAGADDNASGVAVLLEAARVVMGQKPQAAVTFAGFTLEECGMVGSYHYVATLKRKQAKLVGMLSLEMVGFTESAGAQQYPPMLKWFYPPVGNFIALVANRRSQPLLETVERAMRAVGPLPVERIILPGTGGIIPESRLSDHAPFWDAGYPALMVTDTAFLRNPHYHKPTDTLETLDLGFLEQVCQGIVIAILTLLDSKPSC